MPSSWRLACRELIFAAILIQVEAPTRTLETGQVYEESVGSPHQSSNPSADNVTEPLMIQVQNEGEPLMYQAE
jgi:hypothetical protein